MFSFLKAKVWPYMIAGVGVVISVLVVIARRAMKENSRLRVSVENAEAKVNRARVVAKRDMDLIQNEQVREVEIINDLKNSRTDYDPNELFRPKGDS